MKKVLSIFLAITLLITFVSISVSAEEELPEFNYYYNDDGETISVRAYNGSSENVTIPEEIDGYRVTGIYTNTFTSEDTVKSVTIPACITNVDTRAFNAVETLEKVEFLSDGVRNLSVLTAAFFNCTSLKEIDLPSERVYSICSHSFWKSDYTTNTDNWDGSALYLDDILLMTKATELPDGYGVKEGTTVIANEIFTVFDDATGEATRHFKKLILPQSIKVIGSFNYITLEELGDSLERIGLLGEENGLSFTVDTISKAKTYTAQVENNGYVSAEDLHIELVKNGWLLSATPMSLLADGLVSDQMYVIPDGVKYLADDYDLILNDLPGKLYSIKYSEYVIFPDSFKALAYDNPLCSNYNNLLLGITCDSVTFLSKDTVIYDSPDTISTFVSYICGYSGSTAEAYAKKYNREFIDIEKCAHEAEAISGAVAPTCSRTGYSGDTFCGYCGKQINTGKLTGPHNFYETIGPAAYPCEDTIIYYNCTDCDYETSAVHTPGTGHIDDIFDGYCDHCGDFTEKAKSCSCKVCRMHVTEDESFFEAIVPTIMVFFWRLFRINEICKSCGLTHWNR